MICIYSQNNTNYEANGDAVLEPISCDLEITINGAWSLTLSIHMILRENINI